MRETLRLSKCPEVKRIICKVTDYRRHNAVLATFSPMRINSYWDGGSKDEFAIVSLDGKEVRQLPTSTHPYFDVAARGYANQGNEAISVDHVGNITLNYLPDGYALVRYGYFCGKVATATVYVNPNNLTPLLTQ